MPIETKQKLLTKFKEPLCWKDWARTCSYLMDKEFQNRTGVVSHTFDNSTTDINQTVIAFRNGGADFNLAPSIKTFDLKTDALPENVYFIRTFGRDGSVGTVYSNILFYKLLDGCKNPIMVQWQNSLGVPEQHLFALDTLFNRNVTEGLIGEQAIEEDIELVNRTDIRNPLHWFQEAILTEENLTLDQVKALQEIKSSPLVEVFLDKEGTKKIGVVVNNLFASELNNNDTTFEMSVQIKFPNNFDFETGKLY